MFMQFISIRVSKKQHVWLAREKWFGIQSKLQSSEVDKLWFISIGYRATILLFSLTLSVITFSGTNIVKLSFATVKVAKFIFSISENNPLDNF